MGLLHSHHANIINVKIMSLVIPPKSMLDEALILLTFSKWIHHLMIIVLDVNHTGMLTIELNPI